MPAKPLPRLYHTGLIINELDKATAQMSGALGLQWAPRKESVAPLLCPDVPYGSPFQ
jgi:hypothetical protein